MGRMKLLTILTDAWQRTIRDKCEIKQRRWAIIERITHRSVLRPIQYPCPPTKQIHHVKDEQKPPASDEESPSSHQAVSPEMIGTLEHVPARETTQKQSSPETGSSFGRGPATRTTQHQHQQREVPESPQNNPRPTQQTSQTNLSRPYRPEDLSIGPTSPRPAPYPGVRATNSHPAIYPYSAAIPTWPADESGQLGGDGASNGRYEEIEIEEVLRDNQRWLDRNDLDVCLRLKMRTRLSGFQLLLLQHLSAIFPPILTNLLRKTQTSVPRHALPLLQWQKALN